MQAPMNKYQGKYIQNIEECIEDHTLHYTYKKDPHGRVNRRSKEATPDG